MSDLRYPLEIGQGGQDYVTFKPIPYRANAADPGSNSNDDAFRSQFIGASQRVGRVSSANNVRGRLQRTYSGPAGSRTSHTKAAAPPASDAKSVILYMPNSTPPIGNTNNWNDSGVAFQGPFGGLKKQIGTQATNAIVGLSGGGGGGGGNFDPGKVGEELARTLESGIKGSPSIAGQVGLQMLGQGMGTDANGLLAISRGQVYNNNVELLYQSPGMRVFSFSFEFVPKTPEEAEIVNQIILNFKMWSSPAENSSMFEVPHVWQVSYKSGGADNPNMNKFKKAALKNVTVQANPQTDMHVAHPGGVPVSTAMSLEFMEVDIITRQDHFAAGGQGF